MAKQAEQYDPLPNTLAELGDTPNSYVGQGGKVVVVNAAGDSLEFSDRIIVSPTSPHVAITGDLRVTQHGAFGGANISTGKLLNIDGNNPLNPAYGLYNRVFGTAESGVQITIGIAGGAIGQGTPTASLVYGLYYLAAHETPSPCNTLCSVYSVIQSGVSGTGPLSSACALTVGPATWLGSKPATVSGIQIDQQGGAGVGVAYGLKIVDQTAATVRLLELGPGTPYLRLLGGGDPLPDKSNLLLKFGGTLYRVVKTGNYMTLEAA